MLIAVIITVALSMRAPMSSVGPLIGLIREDVHLNSTIAGVLTTIPLIIFAITSPLAGKISARVDNRFLLRRCSLLSIAGMLLRSYCGVTGLLAGTILLGFSIAILNISMPAFIRHQFTSVSLMMGIYSTAMTVSSALAAGLYQPITRALEGRQNSLATSIIFLLAALGVCVFSRSAIEKNFPASQSEAGHIRVLTFKNIAIAVFGGLQSFLFFSLIAWYPSVVKSRCPELESTGLLVLLPQVVSLIPTLIFLIIF